jgi:transposase
MLIFKFGVRNPLTRIVCLSKPLKKSVEEIRVAKGRNEKTSFIIVDAQSVRNTDTAENKGYDAGKKVSGIKRHIAVDTQGLPHAIHITTADITDREGAIAMMSDAKENLTDVNNVLVDGGYSGEKFSLAVKNIIEATVEVAKRSELHQFVVMPQRWVVERSFGWLEKRRRLWKNCERKMNTSLQMVVLAFLVLLLKRF